MNDLSGELAVILITIWWLQKLGKNWQKVNNQHKSLM
jgi:flagellar biogenesis protein FliO